MIQIKRGTTDKWLATTEKLASGQPGYDKNTNKLKIGDGNSTWEDLPNLVGQLDIQPAASATSETGISYGTEPPSNDTLGQLYLQKYSGSVEADYVVEIGRSSNYFYRKWNSGILELYGKGTKPSTVNSLFTQIVYDVTSGDCYEVKGFCD
jgi:hypothetical protein